MLWQEFRSRPLYWLLVALPVAVGLHLAHSDALAVFVASSLAIVPLAALMGRATENLAESLGAGVGGLLNATFGNAAELIIALVAILKGPEMYPLVKASLTGSIIGNALLVLGLAIVLGGRRFPVQTFNRTAASASATLLALATIGMLIPTIYFYVFQAEAGRAGVDPATLESLSLEISFVLAATYAASLWFSLKTHSHLFDGSAGVEQAQREHRAPDWSRGLALGVLLLATVGVALMSELLVESVAAAGQALGMSSVFVGVIVVAIVGNAAEHSTAVLVALKNKMDLAFNIAVGSCIQIALFVAPVLVFASFATGHPPLDLHFTPLEAVAVVISIAVLFMVCQDGESHWLEGVMLLAVYLMLGLAFYHLPDVGRLVE